MTDSAVVFAYHDVGVRCLSVLLAAGVDVRLIVTHADDPDEKIWFESVAALGRAHGLQTIAPDRSDAPELVAAVEAAAPDFIFSFYYRHMLPATLLQRARRGALNMHGSLLPRYRGRVPVNWAVLRGETETGATLHYMTAKPDAGEIVDQMAVPILPDDTALAVFRKVTCAAELVLHRTLPDLLAGRAARRAQDPALASYFGRRRPEDGRIQWGEPAENIHNLVRAVAPPYPGAYFELHERTVRLLRTVRAYHRGVVQGAPRLLLEAGACYAVCGDGRALELIELERDGVAIAPDCLLPPGQTFLPLT